MDKNWKMVKEGMKKFLAENSKYSDFEIGEYFKESIGEDIKHVIFQLSRYKFVSKLMMYKKNLKVLELGCNEALGGGILLQQNTDLLEYVGVDFDEYANEWNKKYLSSNLCFVLSDIFEIKSLSQNHLNNKYFDLVFSLDVIEHIEKAREEEFLQIMIDNMSDDGVAIVGTPSENMAPYASEFSKMAHINLYNQQRLYELASKFFKTVFIFNMNDEIVNTNFAPMSCYIFAICCGKR